MLPLYVKPYMPELLVYKCVHIFKKQKPRGLTHPLSLNMTAVAMVIAELEGQHLTFGLP